MKKNAIWRAGLWYLVAFLGVALDQITKWLAVRYLKPMDTLPLWKNVLHLTYATNRGAAFSILADRRWVFMSVSVLSIVLLAALVWYFRRGSAPFCLSLSMLLGGGVGNMIDRVMLGYVVDFIDFRAIHFAIFNVADCFVCIGCALLLIDVLFLDKRQGKTLPDAEQKEEEKHVG